MSDNGSCVILIFLHELLRAGEGNLVDVFVNFLSRHTDTTVRDSDGVLVELHLYGQVAQLALELTYRG